VSTTEIPYHFEAAVGYSVVTLHPVLNDSQWADIERVGNEVCEKYNTGSAKSVMVDLTELNYMGSAMVALIVRLWKSVKEKNGKMVVVNNNEMVYEVLKLAGLHKVWTIVDSREEGFSKLGVSGNVGSGLSGGGSGSGLLIVGVVALVGAIAGLLMLTQGKGDPKVALMINVVCSLVSLVVGMMLIMKHTDFKQKVGIGIAGIGIISLLAGIMLNSPDAPAANDVEVPALQLKEPADKKVGLFSTEKKTEVANPVEKAKTEVKTETVKTETAKPEEKAKTEDKKETKPKLSIGGKDK
jgi:anti-anti-sigma factor